MRYTTEFTGTIKIDPELSKGHLKSLRTLYDDEGDAYPPKDGRPNSYCQWIVTNDNEIKWDENEKFYNYIEWLEFIIGKLNDWVYTANGTIQWHGEEIGDIGLLVVNDGKLTVHEGFTKLPESTKIVTAPVPPDVIQELFNQLTQIREVVSKNSTASLDAIKSLDTRLNRLEARHKNLPSLKESEDKS